MAIVFYLIEKLGILGREVGVIEEDAFRDIIKKTEELNLECLPYLDHIGDTILNQKQLRMIINELSLLKQCDTLHENEYKVFTLAAHAAAQNSRVYLLINGE